MPASKFPGRSLDPGVGIAKRTLGLGLGGQGPISLSEQPVRLLTHWLLGGCLGAMLRMHLSPPGNLPLLA